MWSARIHQAWLSIIAVAFATTCQPSSLAAQDGGQPHEFVLRGRVIDRSDKPVNDAVVRFSGYVAAGKLGTEKAKTDQVGRFHLVIAAEPQFLNSGASLEAASSDQSEIAYARFPEEKPEQFLESEITIRLAPIRKIQLRVVDEKGNPIAGAKTAAQLVYPRICYAETNDAGIAEISLPEKERILTIVAWKDGKGLDYRSFELSREQRNVVGAKPPEFPEKGEATLALEGTQPFEMRVVDEDQKPLPQVRAYGWLLKKESEPNYLNLSYFQSAFVERTDEGGIARFHWVPKWHQTMMVPHAYSPLYESPHIEYEPTKGDGKVEVKLTKKVRISGQVVHSDGKPANRILVRAANDGGIREMTYTKPDGGFEFFVCPINNLLVTVEDKKWVAGALSGFAIEKDKPRELPKLVLRPATRLHGVLLDQDLGLPAGGIDVSLVQIGRPPVKFDGQINSEPEDAWDLSGIRHSRRIETNAQGEFEFHIGPGFYLLGASPLKLSDYQKLEIKDEPSVEANLKSEIRRRGLFTGKVVNKADGKPVEGAVVESTSNFTSGWKATTDSEGKYAVERGGEPYLIQAISKDGELGGFSEIDAKQKESTIELLPMGKVKGKALDSATGKPLAKVKVRYNSLIWDKARGMGSTAFGGSSATDEEGNFTFEKVIQGREYQIHLAEGRSSVRSFTLQSAETLDLGNLAEPIAARPRTLADRVNSAFSLPGTPLERFEKSLVSAEIAMQHVLVVFGDPADKRVQKLMEIRWNDREFSEIVYDFLFQSTPTDATRRDAASALAKKLEVDLSELGNELMLVLVDCTGKKIATAKLEALTTDGEISKAKLTEFLAPRIFERLDAQKLLDEALSRAKAEKKRVIVEQTATWCGPCQMLAKFLKANPVWEKDYILVKMDERWTNAVTIMDGYRGKAEGGIPWFAILDEDGKMLSTCNHFKTGANIGFPSEEPSREHFRKMLDATKIRLSDKEIEILIQALAKEDVATKR